MSKGYSWSWYVHLKVFVYTCVKIARCIKCGANLLKSDPVVLSVKDVDLFHVVIVAPNKVAFSCQRQFCVLRSLENAV